VPAGALALSLAAAVLHATWNVLLGRARDSEAAGAVAFLMGTVAFAPVAVLVWRVEEAAWPYLAASATLELAYLVLLARAYASGEVGVVYPIARGTAPVLVLVVTALVLAADVSAA
jgi:multidrug transporter EmrE-like cation transporter